MSTSSDDNKNSVEPPSEKKGRRKPASRRKKSKPENELEMIDRHLLETVPMTINGKSKRITAVAGIVFQLVQKDLAVDAYASRVLLKYQALTKRRDVCDVQLEFVDGDVSASGTSPSEDDHG